MAEKLIRVPSDLYPIVVKRSTQHVVVRAAGQIIAETDRALMLVETDHPVVLYVPRNDVALNSLQPSSTTSYCPYKGDARHFDIALGGERAADACWNYEAPYWAVAELEDHFAFNPDRIDRIELS